MKVEPTYIHIFLVQFPASLAVFGLIMFLIGMARRATPMLEAAFYSLVATGVSSILAFFSGRYLSASLIESDASHIPHKYVAYLAVLLSMVLATVVLWLRYLPRRRERGLVLLSLTVLSILFLLAEFLGFRSLK